MGKATWASLLAEIVALRHTDFRTDPDRNEARLDTLESIIITMLEKLRDDASVGDPQ